MAEEFVRIPREEYPQRWLKVREVMKEHQMDAILAYSDDRATYGNAYTRYYADVPTHFEPTLLLFTQEHTPLLLCGPETDGYALEIGVIADVIVLKEFSAEAEDYPFTKMVPLAEVLKEHVKPNFNRIGLAGTEHMGAKMYEAIKAACGEIELADADSVIGPMRGIKSQAELAVIRRAYEIVNLGMNRAIEMVKPGVTEREVAAEAEYVMRKAGCEGYGIDTIVASGPNIKHILARTRNRVIEENDIVVITLAPRYEGYHGACGRTILVGNPGEEAKAAVEAMNRAQDTCAANLIPGKVGSQVEAMGRAIMAEAGYEKNFLYSGLHSVGVIEFEPPILGPSSDTVIEKDMVISIDIPLFETGTIGMRLEDGYIIGENGPEKLTNAPSLVFK